MCVVILSDAVQRLLARICRLSEFRLNVVENLQHVIRRGFGFRPCYLEGVVDGAEVGEVVDLGDEGEGAYGHELDEVGGHGLISSAFDG